MSTPPARRLRTRNEKQESKFEKLRRLRETGKSALDLMKDSDDEDELYTKVDEDEYQRILQTHGADDFVVDDDGSGYVETGTDDIGDTTPRKQSKLKTTKKPIPSKPSAKPDSSKLNAMFRHAQLKSRNASKPKPSAAGDDDEFFSNLLSGLDADTAPRTPQKAAKRKPTTPVSVGGRKMLGSWTQGRQIGIMDISDQVDPFGPPPTKKQKPDESAV
ncbi:DNA-directed DNA polymerase alpha catalytic subunit pol1, partial [Linderina macrospora]